MKLTKEELKLVAYCSDDDDVLMFKLRTNLPNNKVPSYIEIFSIYKQDSIMKFIPPSFSRSLLNIDENDLSNPYITPANDQDVVNAERNINDQDVVNAERNINDQDELVTENGITKEDVLSNSFESLIDLDLKNRIEASFKDC